MANGGGSHRLKVLPISQMPQWIDGEHWWGVWFEDGFDLTPELFASVFSHPFPAPCLFSLGLVPCVFEYYKEVKDTRMYMHKKYLQIYVYSQLLNMNLFCMRIIRSTQDIHVFMHRPVIQDASLNPPKSLQTFSQSIQAAIEGPLGKTCTLSFSFEHLSLNNTTLNPPAWSMKGLAGRYSKLVGLTKAWHWAKKNIHTGKWAVITVARQHSDTSVYVLISACSLYPQGPLPLINT